MSGFEADISHFGVLTGKVSGIGDSLTSAAGALKNIGDGEFGHADLNQAVQQLSGQLDKSLSGLGTTVGKMTDSLHATAKSYTATDRSNAANLTSEAHTTG